MSFTQKSYEEKRSFRYCLQDYMKSVFKFEDFAGKIVLDLGCGLGIDSAEFARNDAQVISLDFARTAIELTSALLKEAGLPVRVVQEDATALPFEENFFDCVYCYGVLHHIPDVEKALSEIKRVLKPGGQVMAMLYHKDSLLYGYSIIYLRGIKQGLLGKLSPDEILSKYSEHRQDCPYTKAYTIPEAKDLFRPFFNHIQIEVHYNVIDLPDQRKVKVGLADNDNLGWHIIIKGRK